MSRKPRTMPARDAQLILKELQHLNLVSGRLAGTLYRLGLTEDGPRKPGGTPTFRQGQADGLWQMQDRIKKRIREIMRTKWVDP